MREKRKVRFDERIRKYHLHWSVQIFARQPQRMRLPLHLMLHDEMSLDVRILFLDERREL